VTPQSDALVRPLCRPRALAQADVVPVIAEVRSARPPRAAAARATAQATLDPARGPAAEAAALAGADVWRDSRGPTA